VLYRETNSLREFGSVFKGALNCVLNGVRFPAETVK
jgi:hypothetical protein